jgi:hypothetical protein
MDSLPEISPDVLSANKPKPPSPPGSAGNIRGTREAARRKRRTGRRNNCFGEAIRKLTPLQVESAASEWKLIVHGRMPIDSFDEADWLCLICGRSIRFVNFTDLERTGGCPHCATNSQSNWVGHRASKPRWCESPWPEPEFTCKKARAPIVLQPIQHCIESHLNDRWWECPACGAGPGLDMRDYAHLVSQRRLRFHLDDSVWRAILRGRPTAAVVALPPSIYAQHRFVCLDEGCRFVATWQDAYYDGCQTEGCNAKRPVSELTRLIADHGVASSRFRVKPS